MASRKTTEEQIADLEAKQAQLKAQIKAKRAILTQAERKKDTRRKILLGAWAMASMTDDDIRNAMDKHLTRAQDRALFGL